MTTPTAQDATPPDEGDVMLMTNAELASTIAATNDMRAKTCMGASQRFSQHLDGLLNEQLRRACTILSRTQEGK